MNGERHRQREDLTIGEEGRSAQTIASLTFDFATEAASLAAFLEGRVRAT